MLNCVSYFSTEMCQTIKHCQAKIIFRSMQRNEQEIVLDLKYELRWRGLITVVVSIRYYDSRIKMIVDCQGFLFVFLRRQEAFGVSQQSSQMIRQLIYHVPVRLGLINLCARHHHWTGSVDTKMKVLLIHCFHILQSVSFELPL